MIYVVTEWYDGDYETYINSAWTNKSDAQQRCVDLAEESESKSPFDWYGDSYSNAYTYFTVKEVELDALPSNV